MTELMIYVSNNERDTKEKKDEYTDFWKIEML